MIVPRQCRPFQFHHARPNRQSCVQCDEHGYIRAPTFPSFLRQCLKSFAVLVPVSPPRPMPRRPDVRSDSPGVQFGVYMRRQHGCGFAHWFRVARCLYYSFPRDLLGQHQRAGQFGPTVALIFYSDTLRRNGAHANRTGRHCPDVRTDTDSSPQSVGIAPDMLRYFSHAKS